MVKHLAKIPSNSFCTFEKAQEVEKFFKTKITPACKRAMDQCVEDIRSNAQWRQRGLSEIVNWINEYSLKV